MLQFGYISDRIVVGDLLDDADHHLFRKVCHSHHSLNHLLLPKRIFTNLRARAGHFFQLPEYTTLFHTKSFIVRVLYKHVLPVGHLLLLCVIVISITNVAFVCAFVT